MFLGRLETRDETVKGHRVAYKSSYFRHRKESLSSVKFRNETGRASNSLCFASDRIVQRPFSRLRLTVRIYTHVDA